MGAQVQIDENIWIMAICIVFTVWFIFIGCEIVAMRKMILSLARLISAYPQFSQRDSPTNPDAKRKQAEEVTK